VAIATAVYLNVLDEVREIAPEEAKQMKTFLLI